MPSRSSNGWAGFSELPEYRAFTSCAAQRNRSLRRESKESPASARRYRVANPERMARRTLRLLNLVNHRLGGMRKRNRRAASRVRTAARVEAALPSCGRLARAEAIPMLAKLSRPAWSCQSQMRRCKVGLAPGLSEHKRFTCTERWCECSGIGCTRRAVWRECLRVGGEGQHGPNVVLQHADAGLVSGLEASLTAMASGDVNWLTTQPPVRAAYEVELREEDLELVGKASVWPWTCRTRR